MLLQRAGGHSVEAIITIHGQREYPVLAPDVPHVLDLEFDDCETPSRTDPIEAARVRLRQREIAEMGLRSRPPVIEDAAAIVAFAQATQGIAGVLLCQCQGGVSRSPAAALLCLASWTGPGTEDRCVKHVLAICPHAVPHLDLVTFGDEVLHREGRLIEALRRAQPR
jgi:predicted protein tyrosine phosphatase